MNRLFPALLCACAMALVGCGSSAQAAGGGTEEAPMAVEVEQQDEPEAAEPDRAELASRGLRNFEAMGFEVYEPVGSASFRDERGVGWTDEHGCSMGVVVLEKFGADDLSTEGGRVAYCEKLVKALAEENGWFSLDPLGNGTAHYGFRFFDGEGNIRDGEVKIVTDGESVYGGKVEYTDGHEDRVELFDLDSLRPAGEPIG